MCICGDICVSGCVSGVSSVFLPHSTTGVPGLELRLSSLLASVFLRSASSSALGPHFSLLNPAASKPRVIVGTTVACLRHGSQCPHLLRLRQRSPATAFKCPWSHSWLFGLVGDRRRMRRQGGWKEPCHFALQEQGVGS